MLKESWAAVALNSQQAERCISHPTFVNNIHKEITVHLFLSKNCNWSVCDRLAPPTITRHPEDVTLSEGSQLHLLASAEGSLPLVFSWYHAGQCLDDADTPELKIESVQLHHAGGYSCKVWQPPSDATAG